MPALTGASTTLSPTTTLSPFDLKSMFKMTKLGYCFMLQVDKHVRICQVLPSPKQRINPDGRTY